MTRSKLLSSVIETVRAFHHTWHTDTAYDVLKAAMDGEAIDRCEWVSLVIGEHESTEVAELKNKLADREFTLREKDGEIARLKDLLATHAPQQTVGFQVPPSDDIRKIEAIKVVRRVTGLRLREAKELVEACTDLRSPNWIKIQYGINLDAACAIIEEAGFIATRPASTSNEGTSL